MIVLFAVSDLGRSVAFWRSAFDWPVAVEAPAYVELRMPEGSLGLYARDGFARNTGERPAEAPAVGTTATELYLRVPDAKAAVARLEAAGARPLSPLAPRPWGERAAYFADPDGNVVAVAHREPAPAALDPGRDTLGRWLADASRYALDHLDALGRGTSTGAAGAEGTAIAREVSLPIPEEPLGDLVDVLPRLDRAVGAALRPNRAGYLAYVPGGGLPAAAVADLIADVTNRFTGLAATAPALVRLEADVLAWLAREVGYGPSARGLLTSGGALANLAAIVTARHDRLGEGADLREATVYASEQVHHTVVRDVRLAGIPEANVRRIPVDGRLRMRVDALEAAVDADRRPFLVVASAGTTNTGAIDPLHSLADLCAARGLWLHADAAYGGAFALCDEGKRRLDGLARADSVALDPHKGMFLPYGTGCVLVRHGQKLAAAHQGGAAYLQDVGDAEEIPSPTDYGPELSRPYRGLRLWLPLMLHGARAFREALADKLALAEAAHDGLARLGLEIVDPPQLSIVAFRRPRLPGEPAEAWDARNEALLNAINARGRVWLSSTRLDGRYVLRVCVLSFRTRPETIDALLDDVGAALAA